MSRGYKKHIVVIGGGTGSYTLLRGLSPYNECISISSVVTMADSGGSTGRLRDEFGYLPVGDVRMALVALADSEGTDESMLRELFMHRFSSEGDISGHNFGNLFLVALTDILGSEVAAIRAAGKILRTKGHVIPVTTDHTNLIATMSNGQKKVGEHEIDVCKPEEVMQRITQFGTQGTAVVTEEAREAILNADLVVLGPGDLYTSILANVVISGVGEALQQSRGRCVYISNLMSKAGQTNGMGVREYISELERYSGRTLDVVVINNTPLPEELLGRYATEFEYPVADNVTDTRHRLLREDLLASEGVQTKAGDTLRRSLIRHDPEKLANVIIGLL